jgi:hypothetical protein
MYKQIIGVVFLLLSMSSCVMTKVYKSVDYDRLFSLQLGLEKGDKNFILKKDSTKVYYNLLKIKEPIFSKNKFIVNKDSSYLMSDVIAYQTDEAYITFTSLCGWTTQRLNIGRICLYTGVYEINRGVDDNRDVNGKLIKRPKIKNATSFKTYLQKDNGRLIEFTVDDLYEMVKKHKPSKELMDTYMENDIKIKRLQLKKMGENSNNLYLAIEEYNKNCKGK